MGYCLIAIVDMNFESSYFTSRVYPIMSFDALTDAGVERDRLDRQFGGEEIVFRVVPGREDGQESTR